MGVLATTTRLVEVYLDRAASSGVAFLSSVPTTWDAVILLLLFATLLFYGLKSGARRLAALILSTYAAFTFFTVFPYFDTIFPRSDTSQGVPELLLFAAFSVVISWVVMPRGGGGDNVIKVSVLAFLEVALFATLAFKVLGYPTVDEVTPLIRQIFTADKMVALWVVLPLVALYFFRRRE